jgi:hypothetical protein
MWPFPEESKESKRQKRIAFYLKRLDDSFLNLASLNEKRLELLSGWVYDNVESDIQEEFLVHLRVKIMDAKLEKEFRDQRVLEIIKKLTIE